MSSLTSASTCDRTVGSKAIVAPGQRCSLDSQSLPVPSLFCADILVHKLVTTESANQVPGGKRHPLWAPLATEGFCCFLEGAVSPGSLWLVLLFRPCVHAGYYDLGTRTRHGLPGGYWHRQYPH